MTDTNQVTVFSDRIKGSSPLVSDKMKLFLQELWQINLESTIQEMRKVDLVLAETAATYATAVTDVREFGAYLPLDHLDILLDDPVREYAKPDNRAETVRSSARFLEERLQNAVLDTNNAAARLDGRALTILGRALHTAGDFFAHTNYVELFLWELAAKNKIRSDLVRAFNARSAPFRNDIRNPFSFLLPVAGQAVPDENAILWYGNSPAETPLASAVFDAKDTAYSLLTIFATHLERTTGPPPNVDEMDIFLAVFDVPGRPLVDAAWHVYKGARDLLGGIGRAAREWLADQLAAAAPRTGAAEALVANAAALVRQYNSAEAAEWARAGKLRYVAHLLATDIASGYSGQSPDKPLLPHHTLINKDKPPSNAEDRLRYALACLLATELCAQIIAFYFSSQFDPGQFASLITEWFEHPSLQRSGNKLPFNEAKAIWICESCYAPGWGDFVEIPGLGH